MPAATSPLRNFPTGAKDTKGRAAWQPAVYDAPYGLSGRQINHLAGEHEAVLVNLDP